MAKQPLALGIRNSNPTNLVHVPANKWQGLAEPPSDGRFCVFTDMPSGIRAAALNLVAYQDKHDLRTIRGVISRWAPHSENDVEAYVRTVCTISGFGENEPLDLQTYEHMQPVMRGMIRQECGKDASLVTPAQIDEGLRRAGIVPAVPRSPAKDSTISLNTISATAGTVGTTIAASEPAWNVLAKIHPNLPIITVAVLGGIVVLAAVFFIVQRFGARKAGAA